VLANNVALAMAGLDNRCVAVTSAAGGEGKTTVAVDLARAMALAGRRVVLVDLDLRHPEAHRRLGTGNDEGASDVLCDRRALQGCLRFVEVGTSALGTTRGLYLLPAGPPVPDPAELLGTRRAARMLAALSEQADAVVVDAAPALPVADTQALARLVGGVILVVDPRRTSAAAARRARDVLARSQARVLGVVINRFEPRRAPVDAAYAYGYGYGPDAM
jgi:capsular exopolysaccharide synthesis family protein